MNPNAVTGLLQLISASVTPVVMISACATLILGINAKNSGTADRVRDLTRILRSEAHEPERRQQNLREQIRIFYRRFVITRTALLLLYLAVFVFIACVLLILFSQKRLLTMDGQALPVFILGVVLMLLAVCFELAEISLSRRSLFLELEDILENNAPQVSPPTRLVRRLLGERKK